MDVEKYRREFVNRVVDARGDKPQKEMARLLDIPLPTYKSYERRSLVPHALLKRYCDITGVEIEWLLGFKTAEPIPKSIQFLWETDAKHRLSEQQCPNLTVFGISHDHDQVMGLCRWDIPGVDAKTKKMKPIMDKHRPLRDFKFTHTDDTGQCREFRISGQPKFDNKGNFTGYRGTGIIAMVNAQLRIRKSA